MIIKDLKESNFSSSYKKHKILYYKGYKLFRNPDWKISQGFGSPKIWGLL